MNFRVSTLVLLSAAMPIAGCAAKIVIQPAAGGLRASQVATIVTSEGSKMGSAALGRVTDAQGRDAVNFNMFNADSRNSAIVVPGTYRIGLICVRGTTLTPSATFELRAGYTYMMECTRVRGSWFDVTAREEPTLRTDSEAVVR
jgi:hypothetical protein